MSRFDETSGFLIDLDGTVWKELELIEGAAESIQELQKAGKRVAALSNRGTHSRRQVASILQEKGVNLAPKDIILTSHVAAEYLRKHHPNEAVWVLGEGGLIEELQESGIPLASLPEDAAWLVVSLHTGVTYHDLDQAFQAVMNGARIIATNNDRAYPSSRGLSIDVAGMLGAIEATTGKTPEVVVGKPSVHMFECAMDRLQMTVEKTMIVGDSLDSDIAMGKYGIKTALVLSGNTTIEMISDVERPPDYVFHSLKDLAGT
ncbi:arabinose operon protein AraL [Halobacillus karajensis]|uniref:HAD-IIA family hydrolase n=1 Tax=Halobacillus karajensis TaxID=195088 RepID=UPI0008A7B713|nr:HAD-IIA family hydrolase [Halobacillus karajensis]SEI00970.1 arabinose operon protein AraL [Halobacillus karajensis]